MQRRRFLSATTGAAASLLMGSRAGASVFDWQETELDRFIRAKMEADHIPGVAAAILNRNGIVWEKAYGWADIEARRPMTLDAVQNIASISKTFTTTAVMQLRDQGLLGLDDNVNEYLPFRLINPNHPQAPITIRQLMTHVSSLRDGTAYSRLYACGDPKISLGKWMQEYFEPSGRYYDRAENFEAWAPGGEWRYCNVSFGLLGYVVERVSGFSFPAYCRRQLFQRLDMAQTAWFLDQIDVSQHLVAYTWFDAGEARGPAWGGLPQGVIRDEGTGSAAFVAGGYRANCTYNHPNYPDGFLRTSVHQLARYITAYLNGGVYREARIVSEATVREMLTPQRRTDALVQGLTWSAHKQFAGEWAWGHGGSDPGVNTDVRMLPIRGVAAIVFVNTNGVRPTDFTDRLLDEALKR